MKNVIHTFKKMPLSRKIQFVAALLVTLAVCITLPVAAWFNYQREVIKLQRVKSPNVLYLTAAHREDSFYFSVDGINAEDFVVDDFDNNVGENQITHKDYVFCVTGDSVEEFTIQLAYTTNNPFEYKIYAAKEFSYEEVSGTFSSGTEAKYIKYRLTGSGTDGIPEVVSDENNNYHENEPASNYLYYQIDASLSTENNYNSGTGMYIGSYLNRDPSSMSGTMYDAFASGAYHDLTYDEYTTVHSDAEPIYYQVTRVSAFPGDSNPNRLAFSRHFILRVEWDAGKLNNTSKETDIVYITVKATK